MTIDALLVCDNSTSSNITLLIDGMRELLRMSVLMLILSLVLLHLGLRAAKAACANPGPPGVDCSLINLNVLQVWLAFFVIVGSCGAHNQSLLCVWLYCSRVQDACKCA